MKLLNRYKKLISFLVDKPKEAVCDDIIDATKLYTTNEDNIQIIIKPTFFDPFAGRGYINLNLSESVNGNKIAIECEIVPTSITERGIYLVASLLSLLTIVDLLISHNFYSFFDYCFWLDNANSCYSFDTDA